LAFFSAVSLGIGGVGSLARGATVPAENNLKGRWAAALKTRNYSSGKNSAFEGTSRVTEKES
jgi:hypothetical protein